MTNLENFYKQDTQKYEIAKNRDLMMWLNCSADNGYYCFVRVAELQDLINSIVNWYEMRFPENLYMDLDEIKHGRFKNIKDISEAMDVDQLLYRLSHNQFALMSCAYRSKGMDYRKVKNGKEMEWKLCISMKITKKSEDPEHAPFFTLLADPETGKIIPDPAIEEYIDSEENVDLESLLAIFQEKYADQLDFTELEKVLYDYSCDIELRHRLLELAALKMVYSRNTIPEYGYKRAKKFIEDFNEHFGLLLSTNEIDEIMASYHNEKTGDGKPTITAEAEVKEGKTRTFIRTFLGKIKKGDQ